MFHHQSAARALAVSLAAASVLSLSALAAPVVTATRVPTEPATTAAHAVTASESPVEVSASQASGSFDIIYQDQSGAETTATITAVSPDDTAYATVNVGGSSLRVRQGPGTGYGILGNIYDGNSFAITGKTNGWYQINYNGRTGYVSADYVLVKTLAELQQPVTTPATPTTPVTATPTPAAPAVNHNAALADQIVAYALQFKGYPYVYATAGPNSFDCSGFTSYVYAHFGYTLNRSSKDQLKNGVAVSKSALQPADLLLFSKNGTVVSHVGLYIGGGKFIHASTSTTGVIISDLNSTYYTQHYFAARRII